MKSIWLSVVLCAGAAAGLWFMGARLLGSHLPGNQQGYSPPQPIAFSHRQHAGDLQIPCLYCHSAADRGPHAGIPSARNCMNCHRFVTASRPAVLAEEEQARQEGRPPHKIVSAELQKLYDALGLDDQLQRDPAKLERPIAWVRVHHLPAYTRFDHRAHVKAGVECSRCHGAVETMDRVGQVEDLSMGWCVNCHRERSGNGHRGSRLTDCVTCHY